MLVNVYRRLDQHFLYHLDAYRLHDAEEATDLDIETMVESGSMVIEWADRIENALPEAGLWIHMKWIDEQHRDILVVSKGDRAGQMLAKLRQEIYGKR